MSYDAIVCLGNILFCASNFFNLYHFCKRYLGIWTWRVGVPWAERSREGPDMICHQQWIALSPKVQAKDFVNLLLTRREFGRCSVTPFMHILAYRVPGMIKHLGNMKQFSGQGIILYHVHAVMTIQYVDGCEVEFPIQLHPTCSGFYWGSGWLYF